MVILRLYGLLSALIHVASALVISFNNYGCRKGQNYIEKQKLHTSA